MIEDQPSAVEESKPTMIRFDGVGKLRPVSNIYNEFDPVRKGRRLVALKLRNAHISVDETRIEILEEKKVRKSVILTNEV